MSEALREVDAVWLGKPNNPTGSMISKEMVLTMAARFPNTWFLVDEAFVQFTEEWEEESLLLEKPLPNLLAIHSLTKFYCLPGLRMGAVYGHRDIISRLRHAKEPWTVNGIADRIAPLLGHLHSLFLCRYKDMIGASCVLVGAFLLDLLLGDPPSLKRRTLPGQGRRLPQSEIS